MYRFVTVIHNILPFTASDYKCYCIVGKKIVNISKQKCCFFVNPAPNIITSVGFLSLWNWLCDKNSGEEAERDKLCQR